MTGGKDGSGQLAWYYVQVDPHQRIRFERVIKSGAMVLTEYGKVLLSGYGAQPNDSARAFMKNEHGFEG